MGVSGPIPFHNPARGNPGKRPPRGPRIPADVLEKAREIYKRELAMGDHFMAIEETRLRAEGGEKIKAPSQALYGALKCYKEALYTAYRIAGVAETEEVDKLAEHLSRRPKAPKAG